MTRLGLFKIAMTVAMLAVMGGKADAGLLIDAGPASTQSGFSGGNYVAGSEFTTSSSFTIRSLGWLDVEGDGLLFSHQVGLWNSSQTLLASATVTATSGTVVSAQGTAVWYLEDIAPLVIGPGTYRVAGLVGANTHLALSNDKIGNGVTISSGYVRTDFPNGGFNYPNLTFSTQAIRATLSTDSVSTVSAVPEPATVVLMSIGVVGMVVGIPRRRRGSRRDETTNAATPSVERLD